MITNEKSNFIYRFNFSVGSIPDNYISEHTFSIEVILSELAFGQEILSINDRSAEILAQVLTFLVEHVKTVKGNPSFIEKKISFGADNINILPETKTDIDKPPIFEIPQ